jgi:hypothetical protein
MDLKQEVMSLLRDAEYRVKESSESGSSLYFEDSSIIGFAAIEASYEEILNGWRTKQAQFLQVNARKLRGASEKAWNAYAIFLTPARCNDEQKRNLYLIEEDFQGTRKIARSDILTRDDVQRALYPILPVRNITLLERGNSLDRLWLKLELSDRARAALVGETTANDLANVLLDESK